MRREVVSCLRKSSDSTERAQISPPLIQSLQPCQPRRFIYMHHQPARLNQSERERLLPTFTGQVTSCLSLAWLGALKIFSIDMCGILAVTNNWEVHMNICIYFRDVIDWTTFIIQWNLSFGTTLFSRHKICSKKNFHIIFVSITSIEGTPLFKEKGQFFWALKTRFAFNKGTP